ncbi:hypothetical protein BKK56_08335 [Rodentibacter genomosp. 2]|uniref:Uncharacterized protein n=1 Tax=Rodentibacter mrazii TaxID=1908257 RepID=A0A1V3IGN6_9PAST|nr:hypothetical protein BKK47_05025 [Rodentibacter mrazii]OOF54803.1 hypothetical protein BKK56_08335 [Rodentibacter genomosp. 2]
MSKIFVENDRTKNTPKLRYQLLHQCINNGKQIKCGHFLGIKKKYKKPPDYSGGYQKEFMNKISKV